MKILVLCYLLLAVNTLAADTTAPATTAINSLGADLMRAAANPGTNALFSPYSIQSVLAMTYAGAAGTTREEMTKALHFGTNDGQLQGSFALLQKQLQGMMQRSAKFTGEDKENPFLRHDPITLTIANRLFGQSGYPFHPAFLNGLSNYFQAPLLQMDFSGNPEKATSSINEWVNAETKQRIPNLLPEGALNLETCLVLINAVYFKAPWATPFYPKSTKPGPFHLSTGGVVDVPLMWQRERFGYQKYKGFTAITLQYAEDELQFLILLPDEINGLAALESQITQFSTYANLPERDIILSLPKFKMTPPTLALNSVLQRLGMKSAFNPTEANFSRMANRPIFIQGVFHKTFLTLDELGTEAAAATSAVGGEGIPEKTITITVDHPFLFAIQHRASGACLFLGHLVDPR